MDGTVSEISILTEQLSVVRRNRDVGVLGNHIEQLLHYLVQITDGPDLTLPKLFHLGIVEKLFFALPQLAANHQVVKVLEYSVHATDARPFVLGLVRHGVWVVRLADIQHVKRRPGGGELVLPHHRAHGVMLVHQLVAVESLVQHCLGIEHGQGNHGMRAVSQGLVQEYRQVEARHEGPELNVTAAQTLVELQEILLIVFRRVHVLRAQVGHQSDEQIVVRRRSPGRVRPAALDLAELLHCLRPGAHKRVVAATVEDHQDVVIWHNLCKRHPAYLLLVRRALSAPPPGWQAIGRGRKTRERQMDLRRCAQCERAEQPTCGLHGPSISHRRQPGKETARPGACADGQGARPGVTKVDGHLSNQTTGLCGGG